MRLSINFVRTYWRALLSHDSSSNLTIEWQDVFRACIPEFRLLLLHIFPYQPADDTKRQIASIRIAPVFTLCLWRSSAHFFSSTQQPLTLFVLSSHWWVIWKVTRMHTRKVFPYHSIIKSMLKFFTCLFPKKPFVLSCQLKFYQYSTFQYNWTERNYWQVELDTDREWCYIFLTPTIFTFFIIII